MYAQQLLSVPNVYGMSLAKANEPQKLLLNFEGLLGLTHGDAGNTGGTSGTKGLSFVGVNPFESGSRTAQSYTGGMESNGRYAYKVLLRNIDGFNYDVFLMRGSSEGTMDRIEAYRLTVN